MPANFTPVFNGYSGFKPLRFWCQKVLPLVYDDSLSYYELLNKVVVYLNNTMEDVGIVEGNLDALLNSYNQLQDYVNTYFDNLDISPEINERIDEMIASGEFADIIRGVVSQELPDELAELLPLVVAEQLSEVVASQLGAEVASQISATVAGQIGAVVQSQIGGAVSEQLGGVVSQQLPVIVNPIATQVVAQMIPGAAASWLANNVRPSAAGVVDRTLSISGTAADAKVTGDRIRGIQESLAGNTSVLINYRESVIFELIELGGVTGKFIQTKDILQFDEDIMVHTNVFDDGTKLTYTMINTFDSEGEPLYVAVQTAVQDWIFIPANTRFKIIVGVYVDPEDASAGFEVYTNLNEYPYWDEYKIYKAKQVWNYKNNYNIIKNAPFVSQYVSDVSIEPDNNAYHDMQYSGIYPFITPVSYAFEEPIIVSIDDGVSFTYINTSNNDAVTVTEKGYVVLPKNTPFRFSVVDPLQDTPNAYDEDFNTTELSTKIDAYTLTDFSNIVKLNSVGYPPQIVADASNMSDQKTIYIYVGETLGSSYINGHWYYYDLGWQDGGLYSNLTVKTDDTLTLTGMAADAKATGDKINEVLAGFDDVDTMYEMLARSLSGYDLIQLITEPGTIYASNGNDNNNATQANAYKRSDFIPVYKGVTLRYYKLNAISSNLCVGVYDVNKNYNSSLSVAGTGSTGDRTGRITFTSDGYIRLSKGNGRTDAEANLEWTDRNFNKSGVAADSKAVGEALEKTLKSITFSGTTLGGVQDNSFCYVSALDNVTDVPDGYDTSKPLWLISYGAINKVQIIYADDYTPQYQRFYSYTDRAWGEWKSVTVHKKEKPVFVAIGASTTEGAIHHMNDEPTTRTLYKWPEYTGELLEMETYNLAIGNTGLIARKNQPVARQKNFMDVIYENSELLSTASLIAIQFAYGNDRYPIYNESGTQTEFPIGNWNDYYPYDETGYHPSGATDGVATMLNLGATYFGCLNWCIKYISDNYPKAQLILIFGAPSANFNRKPTIVSNEETAGYGVPPYVLNISEKVDGRLDTNLKKLVRELNLCLINEFEDSLPLNGYNDYAKNPDNTYVLFSTTGTANDPVWNSHPNDNGYLMYARYKAAKISSLFNHN